MNDYIKREDALNAIHGLTMYRGTIPFDSVIFNINKVPPADVVEVVRCSECKYNISNPRRFIDDDIILTYAWCEYLKEVNGFCSYGKRENFTGGGL